MGTDAREPLLDPGDDPRVGEALATIAQALAVPPDEVTAQRHRRAIVRARQLQPLVLARRSAATGVAAAVLVGALAVGGALPGTVQDAVADLAGRVGFDLPRSSTDEVPPPLPATTTDDEPTDPETSQERDGSAGLDRGTTVRDDTRDAGPATGGDRGGATDDAVRDASPSDAPAPPAEGRPPSDPPADAPGSDTPGDGAPGSSNPGPAPAPGPKPTPSDPPATTRPSPSVPPQPPARGGPSEQDEAAAPRADDDRSDRGDRRAAATDGPASGPAHPA
jgi:hypothetical protein